MDNSLKPSNGGACSVFGAFPFWCLLAGNAGNGGKSGPVEQFKPVEHSEMLRSRLTAPDRECDCRLWFVAGAGVFGNVRRWKPAP